MTDCLIVGGDASLGAALCGALTMRGLTVVSTSRRADRADRQFLDLDTLEGLDALPAAQTVALVAAETRFAECANAPERTRRINVEAPVAVARKAFGEGARVVFFSSIAVHDGTRDQPGETFPPSPNSTYGEQKRAAELALLTLADETGGNLAILRPSKVIPPDFALFTQWLTALKAGEVITPFSDMLIAPISRNRAIEAATALLLLTGDAPDTRGIFQLSARDQVDYASLARTIAQAIGADAALVQPKLARETLDPATLWLPEYARLGVARLTRACGIEAPPSLEAVETFLAGNGHHV